MRWYALGVSLTTFLITVGAYLNGYDPDIAGLQLRQVIPWVPDLGLGWSVGADGLSMPLILLTSFITTLACLAAWPVTFKPRLFYFLLLAMDGGQIFAELQDAETGLRLGHATMDVRYHAGGSEPQTAIPGQTITMLMEFQGMDVILPAGNGLRFVITDTGEDYLAPACGTACVVHVLPSMSTFEAPIIDRTNSEVLITPQSEEAANNQ